MPQLKGSFLSLALFAGTLTLSAQPVANTSLAATAAPAAPSVPPTAEAAIPIPTPGPANATALQTLRDEIARLNLEKERLLAAQSLSQVKLDQELASSRDNTTRLQTELAEKKARQELEDFATRQKFESEVASLRRKNDQVLLSSSIAKAEVEQELAEIRHVENSTKKDVAQIWANLELEKQQAESRNYALASPVYLKDPLEGRKLVLSDRRIPLNGVITMSTADQIIERINYFNNRDRTLPIFIVIDDCPGGSVMAGYKILKSMNGSEAPVHVVVKSFAASMAACLTTLSAHSYAYPNAVILHHQITSFGGGNLTQQQEWIKEMEEWWRRLADPVAAKMGISRDEFIKKMYSHASSGDWNEFGDNAQKLKWVDTTVDEIEETGLLKNPDLGGSGPVAPHAENDRAASGTAVGSQQDDKGRPFMVLPRLNPYDCYWLYNPDGYYRLP